MFLKNYIDKIFDSDRLGENVKWKIFQISPPPSLQIEREQKHLAHFSLVEKYSKIHEGKSSINKTTHHKKYEQ